MAELTKHYPRACIIFVVHFTLFTSSARLSTIHQLSSRSSAIDVHAFEQSLRDDGDPPLEGCQANFFSTTCCCFIDAGILKQEGCGCTDSRSSCETRIRASYHNSPSKPVNSEDPRWWEADKGYFKGYKPVEKKFCMAAPVEEPQVDSHERAFECTCSTNMGASVEMPCGSGCNVENCKRWNPNKLDWAPFTDGRGKCCLSSFTSATKGCEQEVEALTEAGAKTVLSNATRHAGLGKKTAFVVSADLVVDMTRSFQTAKQKKVSTSRSGAEFFFSGDYGYILKSIHRPEYDVLYQIVQPQPETWKRSLIEHLQWNRQQASVMKEVRNCYSIVIKKMPKIASEASHLADTLDYTFISVSGWRFDAEASLEGGSRVWRNGIGTLRAVWCEKVSQYRIQKTFAERGDCADLENDALYIWLKNHQRKTARHWLIRTTDAVLEVHSDFTKAFEVAPSSFQQQDLKFVTCHCEVQWWPSSLINDFVIAFEYKSSTWMVVKNSVTAVRQELERHQFTSFHKEYDMFDVKPFPIHSDQRALLFGMQFTKTGMRNWANWLSVRKNLWNDIRFMNSILNDPMVDYSLLVSAFYIDDDRMVLEHANLTNCVEERLDLISTVADTKDYGDARGSILVCFSIIDMLMEFTFAKTPENLLLFQKWSSWGNKMEDMFDCLGDMHKDGCDKYKKLRPDFRGVDIPKMMSPADPIAFVQDVTDLIDADGEMKVLDELWSKYDTYKCCCNAGEGRCQLADRSGKSGWSLFGNPSGCGSLVGKDWHSYWRYAGHCRLPKDDAEQIRRQAVLLKGVMHWGV